MPRAPQEATGLLPAAAPSTATAASLPLQRTGQPSRAQARDLLPGRLGAPPESRHRLGAAPESRRPRKSPLSWLKASETTRHSPAGEPRTQRGHRVRRVGEVKAVCVGPGNSQEKPLSVSQSVSQSVALGEQWVGSESCQVPSLSWDPACLRDTWIWRVVCLRFPKVIGINWPRVIHWLLCTACNGWSECVFLDWTWMD